MISKLAELHYHSENSTIQKNTIKQFNIFFKKVCGINLYK